MERKDGDADVVPFRASLIVFSHILNDKLYKPCKVVANCSIHMELLTVWPRVKNDVNAEGSLETDRGCESKWV